MTNQFRWPIAGLTLMLLLFAAMPAVAQAPTDREALRNLRDLVDELLERLPPEQGPARPPATPRQERADPFPDLREELRRREQAEPAGEPTLGDPTRGEPDLRSLLEVTGEATPNQMNLPTIQKRGYVAAGRASASVVLQIGEEVLLIREGDRFDIPFGTAGRQTIRVIRVAAEGIELEVEPLGLKLMSR